VRSAPLLLGLLLIGCASTRLEPTTDEAWWRDDAAAARPELRYQGVERTSRYVTLRDGVALAVDVYLPHGLAEGARVPAILIQTRYVRRLEGRAVIGGLLGGRFQDLIRYLVRSGYAWVYVDARGSGASYGSRATPYSPEEVADLSELVDWIVAQPWSDGQVGAWGSSYTGGAALHLLASRHPAVKAVMARFAMFDMYADVLFPGGIRLDWLVDHWSRLGQALDRNKPGDYAGLGAKLVVKGSMPVDDDKDRVRLKEAVTEHAANGDLRRMLEGIEDRDDISPLVPGASLTRVSPHARLADMQRAEAPLYLMSGWFDVAFIQGAVNLFHNLPAGRARLTLGPWDHGGLWNISHAALKRRPRFDFASEARRFFDAHLRDRDTGIEAEAPVHYFTMVEERWKSAPTWPPPGLERRTLHLGPEHGLGDAAPNEERAFDEHLVDPDTGTGDRSRWDSLINLKKRRIRYSNRKQRDRKLLLYESAPLPADLEITGHAVAHLHLSSTARDGNVFVYLEDVDRLGRVRYVTEGLLRIRHRALSEAPVPYEMVGPQRLCLEGDARPLAEGEIAELVIPLLPTSYLFREGHRLRVALSGADRDHFTQHPAEIPTWRVYRDATHPSRIELPVMPREVP
jgi:uncharacterized protein